MVRTLYTATVLLLLVNNIADGKVNLTSPQPTIVRSSTFGDDKSRRVVSIIGLVQYAGSLSPMGPLCSESMRIALDTIKATPNFLENYELTVEYLDDTCSRPVGVSKLLGELQKNGVAKNRLPITVGPLCTDHLYTGQLLQYYNFIGLTSFSSLLEPYRYRSQYRNFFLFAPSIVTYYEVLYEFIVTMGWKKIAIIGDSSDYMSDVERFFVDKYERFDALNKVLGIVKLPYVTGSTAESDQIQPAAEELKKLKPRIIIINSVSTARIACWLHRMKLYGPNYVYFVRSAVAFQPNDPTRFTWCTETMLAEILESVFYFGFTPAMNLDTALTVNSFGMTGQTYDNLLRQAVDGAEKSSSWSQYRSHCHDMVLAAAHVLNRTEDELNQRNETLSDWLVAGSRFKADGQEVMEMITESLYSSRFRLTIGDIEFDRQTTLNKGRTWLAIFQVRRNVSSGTLTPIPIFVYNPKSKSKNHLDPAPGRLIWRTHDGAAPSDSVNTLYELDPLVPLSGYATLTVLSAIQLVVCLLIAAHHYWHSKCSERQVKDSIPSINGFILAGNIVAQGYILGMPQKSNGDGLAMNCMLSYGCLLLGFGLQFFGMLGKLELANSLANDLKKLYKLQPTSREMVVSDYLVLRFEKWRKQIVLGGFVLLVVNCILLVIWFYSAPLVASQLMKEVNVLDNRSENTLRQHYSYDCRSSDSQKTILASFAVIYGIIILRSAFLVFTTRKKQIIWINDMKSVVTCFCSTMSLLAAFAMLGGAIFSDTSARLQILIDALVLACVAMNLGSIFIPTIAGLRSPSPIKVEIAPSKPSFLQIAGTVKSSPSRHRAIQRLASNSNPSNIIIPSVISY